MSTKEFTGQKKIPAEFVRPDTDQVQVPCPFKLNSIGKSRIFLFSMSAHYSDCLLSREKANGSKTNGSSPEHYMQ